MPYTFLAIFAFFLILFTVLDFFVKRDETYSYEEILVIPENFGKFGPWGYEVVTASYFLLHFTALVLGLYYIQFEKPFLAWIIYSYLLGISGATVLTLCHEYFHHTNIFEKWVGRFFLSLFFFNVYEYDHIYNHHNEEITCSEKDPSFAKLNESVYAFVQKYFLATFKASLDLQREFCKQAGTPFYNIFKNTLLKWMVFSAALPFIILFFVGWKALLLYFLHAYFSLFMYLSGAYNQHYGLARRTDKDGVPEDFTYMNVWASDHFMTGKLYINVSHHGHHHLFNLCRYPYLKVLRLGPILPYGYNAIILLSMFPKLWYKIMNPRVEEVFKQRDILEKEGKL